MDFEDLMPRRALGNGRWDRKLKERLTQLSVADNYNEANKEWIVTDNVWYVPFGEDASNELPDYHCMGNELQNHPHECLCGHPIVWHFEIQNTENNNMQIVGSEHIESYMVIRHFEKQGIDPNRVTEEMIEEWLTEKVKALKAEWWWNLHGEQFEQWFDEVGEIDLRVNVRQKGELWDGQTRRYEPQYVIRKRAEGTFGTAGYKMASIVWRWNHPDNARKQIETRGYPNERLWNDLQMFAILIGAHKAAIEIEESRRNDRIEDIEAKKLTEAKEQEERQIRYAEMHKERMKEEEKRKIEDAQLEGVREEKRLSQAIAGRIQAENDNTIFAEMCDYYDLPVFNPNLGATNWEKRFLTDMVYRLTNRKKVSDRQIGTLKNIIIDEPLPASNKQIWYIKKLAGDDYEIPENLDKRQASFLINKLKGEEE